jgi:hypothetical protein
MGGVDTDATASHAQKRSVSCVGGEGRTKVDVLRNCQTRRVLTSILAPAENNFKLTESPSSPPIAQLPCSGGSRFGTLPDFLLLG